MKIGDYSKEPIILALYINIGNSSKAYARENLAQANACVGKAIQELSDSTNYEFKVITLAAEETKLECVLAPESFKINEVLSNIVSKIMNLYK